MVLNEKTWPIGLSSTYDEEYIRRIASGFISYMMRLRSIDYTYKAYLKETSYPTTDFNRLDLRIDREITVAMEHLAETVYHVSSLEPKNIGQTLCEWTYFRIPFAMKMLMSLAHKGVYYESFAVARSLLEQLAWASAVDMIDDAEQVRGTSATASITRFRKFYPHTGRLYGWLSDHSHWAYVAHVKSMDFSKENLGAIFASPRFKARVMLLCIIFCQMILSSFLQIKQALTMDEHVSKADDQMTVLSRLIDEVLACDPEDADFVDLARFRIAVSTMN